MRSLTPILLLNLLFLSTSYAQTYLATPTDKSNIVPKGVEYYYGNWSRSLDLANNKMKNAKSYHDKFIAHEMRFKNYYNLLTDQPEDILLIFWDEISSNRDRTCYLYRHIYHPDKENDPFRYDYYKREHAIMSKVCGAVQQSYNKNLQKEIAQMSADDLKYRNSSIKNHIEQEKLDLVNQEKALKIIDKYGFPNLNMIDEGLNEFISILLRGNKAYVEKIAPLIKHEIHNARIPEFHIMKLEDRLCQLNSEPQKYGTAFTINANGESELYKTIEIKQVNINRAKYGFDPL